MNMTKSAAAFVFGVCAAFGGDYLVIDCHPPYGAVRCASSEVLPHGGLTNRIYARDYLVMRRIPAAGQKFRMGNERAEADAMTSQQEKRDKYYTNALPHDVTLAADYWMSVYPLTQRQSVLLTGQPNTSWFDKPETTEPWKSGYGEPDERPVEFLSWEDLMGQEDELPADGSASARSVLGVIRDRTGWAFALPTDAQWEFACRAGTKGPWNFVAEADAVKRPDVKTFCDYGWFGWMGGMRYPGGGTHWGATHPVGLLKPNAFGLYDMHGNVWEWCIDRFSPGDARRVVRGGSYSNGPADCRSAFRYGMLPETRSASSGVRLVLAVGAERGR
jgi:formylglycine-generating enzyme required for sulfatase activity